MIITTKMSTRGSIAHTRRTDSNRPGQCTSLYVHGKCERIFIRTSVRFETRCTTLTYVCYAFGKSLMESHFKRVSSTTFSLDRIQNQCCFKPRILLLFRCVHRFSDFHSIICMVFNLFRTRYFITNHHRNRYSE